MKNKAELVVVSMPGVGHVVSTIEFAKNLIERNDQLHISIIVMKFPTTPFVDQYAKSLTASQPNLQLIHLPDQVEGLPTLQVFAKSVQSYYSAVIACYKPHVRKIVSDMISSRSSPDSVPVVGLVLDLFCVSLIDVGNEFDLPSYIFFTTGTPFLSLMLHLPPRHEQVGTEFSFSDPDVSLPGIANPVPIKCLPDAVFNKDGGYDTYLNVGRRLKDVKGILVNTVSELESQALQYLNSAQITSIYTVGPVLHLKSQPHPDMEQGRWGKIKTWLDEQPESSVVFLCFGSSGSLSVSQVKEMALGLEQSGHRFLWSLRLPPVKLQETMYKSAEEMLPEGFLERVRGRGMVCGWAPQVEVLAHKATGGFVSHCGWNSILESLWYGVPIVALPIYAEQQINAFAMVKELGLAVELKMDYRQSDVIPAEEVKTTLTRLMDNEEELKRKVKNMSEISRKALKEGGSSSISISRFMKDLLGSSYFD
ncbi:UDP-glycosyltransferase 71K1 [Ricinus communis]|uniref:Glycosyltransferase n=1 Tax=Ricinus communis TaxID=3988 RepID=B9SI09_RICCO|nr:UDP-glycosyltransferase 71K1 [Ricinus communis]EEF36746.1 UDP-glucosyltransferase, putative [Ricinus communis]|eukprot:XP_025014300.1 UDP-glycosyltransferase 71K1-like [Ricinus communis]